jgi:hypothetical protein
VDRLSFKQILDRSSLSTPAALEARRRTPAQLAERLVSEISATDLATSRIGAVQPQSEAIGGTGPMSNPNDRHVVPNPEGGWDVVKPNAGRSSSHHNTQAEAIDRGREIVHNAGGGELLIHGEHGQIRQKDTIAPGPDPYPPRG